MDNKTTILIIDTLMYTLTTKYEAFLQIDFNDQTSPDYYASAITLEFLRTLLEKLDKKTNA